MFESAKNFIIKLVGLALSVAALLLFTGCETSKPNFPDVNQLTGEAANPVHLETIILREGDSLKVSFPAAANLNTTAVIRRDGNITLPLVGEVRAAGKTPIQLKDELVKLYTSQIETKELSVEVLVSQFPVYVTGAVLQPHKVMSDHPMTAMEAIMECGGFDYTRANLKSVLVLRRDGTHLASFPLDFKKILRGDDDDPFYLKPGDVIYVKEKFSWY